jgi:hypothetical protein
MIKDNTVTVIGAGYAENIALTEVTSLCNVRVHTCTYIVHIFYNEFVKRKLLFISKFLMDFHKSFHLKDDLIFVQIHVVPYFFRYVPKCINCMYQML